MTYDEFLNLTRHIVGCTFASLDATTFPRPRLKKVVVGERVILHVNKTTSGYQTAVRKRLEELGKDPLSFNVDDLPWGQRIEGSPIIQHKGRMYLQTVVLAPGMDAYFIGDKSMTYDEVKDLLPRHNSPGQGLPIDKQVVVKCYALDSIDEIRLMGERVMLERPSRPILSIRV